MNHMPAQKIVENEEKQITKNTSNEFENKCLFDSVGPRRVATSVLFWCFCTNIPQKPNHV